MAKIRENPSKLRLVKSGTCLLSEIVRNLDYDKNNYVEFIISW